MTRVFLAGSIRGVPRQDALGWRVRATELLAETCQVRHALRGREEEETLPDSRLAIARDFADVRWTDILLVDDTKAGASMIGTAMEIHLAHSLGKTIIAFGEAHAGDYFLDFHIHARVADLEEACALINRKFVEETR